MALLCFLAFPAFAQQAPYWQQRVDNDISVTLNDTTHFLSGHIRMRYQNNSPDTLTFLYFHLYPNAYSSDRTAYEKQAVENGHTMHYFSDEQDRGFIDSLQFSAGSDTAALRKAGYVATTDPDIIRLILPEPLLPGASTTIETPFRVKIPHPFSRLGHSGQAYQVSQWFPKPAVYDAQGWHPVPYLDQGEFYSEYGSWKVAVTLPKNYIIMGTGNIAEASERSWIDSMAARPLPPQRDRRAAYFADTVKIPSAPEMKTVTFEEDNVHDFAWFADKRWIVRKDTVAVPGTGNVVTAYTCFLPSHVQGWEKSMDAVKTGIREYSRAVGAYPYKTVKAVEGALSAGGGMEYPTVTVIAATNNGQMVRTAIVHEVGHNWFYGILGSNERSYPWMDEGINSFYEQRFVPMAPMLGGLGNRNENYLAYAMVSATHDLVPADTAAGVMPEINYGTDIYAKAPYMLNVLESYMGKEGFSAAMHEYYESWKFRHPQPGDFERIFRKHSKEDIGWFFSEAMHSTKPVDFAIRRVNRKGYTVVNRTGLKIPLQVVFYQDATDSASRWIAPFTGSKRMDYGLSGRYARVRVGEVMPDYNIRNNEDRSPLSLRPFMGFNLSAKTRIWYLPAIGYNYYDGFMGGLLLHNLSLPQNRFQFALTPMYGFGSKTFAGTGFVGYSFWFDRGWLHDIQLKVEGKTFSYDKTNMNLDGYLYARYAKVAPELVLNLRKPSWRSTVERSISLKGYWIREEQFSFTMNPSDSLYYPAKGGYTDNFYGRARYEHRNARTFNPFSYALEGQAGKQFAKLSLEANLRIDYFRENKALYIRGYAGKFFNFAGDAFDSYRYRIANTYSGWNDYLYDETYVGRNEQTGLWSQQISMKEGGFKINTLQYASQLGLSDNWLFSLNLKSDLPFWKLPLRLFLDVATFSDAKQRNPSGAGILYAGGIEFHLSDYFSVYVPLVMSKDFSEYTKSVYPDNRFLKTISFSLNLGKLNWMQLPSKILKM